MLKKFQIFLVIGFLLIGISSTSALAGFITPKASVQKIEEIEPEVDGKKVLAPAPMVMPAKPSTATPAPMATPAANPMPRGVKPIGIKTVPKGIKPAPMVQITSLTTTTSTFPGFPYKFEYEIRNSGAAQLVDYSLKPYVLTDKGRSYPLSESVFRQAQVPPGQVASGNIPFKLTNVPQKAIKDLKALRVEVWGQGKKMASKRVPFTATTSSAGMQKLIKTGDDINTQKTPAIQAAAATQATTSFKPQIPGGIADTKPLFMAAELSDLRIGTEADGRWYWEATVKNTGTGMIAADRLTVQGTQTGFGQSTVKPASGSIMPHNISKDQSVAVKRYWTRCCRSRDLNVELKNSQSNQVLDTKSVTNMSLGENSITGTNLKIINITWNDNQKTWQVTIRNRTDFNIKLVVQAYRLPAAGGPFEPAGGRRILAPANSNITTSPLVSANMLDGDKLKVALIYDETSDYCSDWDSPKDCGAERGNITTIPNNADFP